MLKRMFIFSSLALCLTAAVHAQDLGKLDAGVKSQMDSALQSYYAVKDALVASDAQAASARSGELVGLLQKVDENKFTAGQKEFWAKTGPQLKDHSEKIRDSKDLAAQRTHFSMLSNFFYSAVSKLKVNSGDAYLQYCPMKKASWLSLSKEIRNPYYGDKMLECGSVRETLKNN